MGAGSRRRIFNHFAMRLRERFGEGLDAHAMWRGLSFALAAEDWCVLRPVVRINRAGRRVFACRLRDGRWCFVLFDCEIGLPVTVFSEGMVVRREGKGSIRLEVPRGF